MDEAELSMLMNRALSGDSAAYSAVLGYFADRLRGYFRRRLFRQPQEAEDLVQEVLLAIHAKRGTFDTRQPVSGWVYAIARYKLVDHLRRTKRRGIHVPIDDAGALFAAGAEAGEANHDVETLLGELPAKQRDAIRMVKLEELTIREAADKAKLTQSDIKISVHRGLRRLSKIVRGEE